MKIRLKTFLLVSAVGIGIVSALYAASQSILLQSYARLEQKNVYQNVQRVVSAISNDLIELNGKTGDWAERDGTYEFVEDLNPDYLEANVVSDASFQNLRINLLLFVNSTGSLVCARGFDLQNSTEAAVPQSIVERVSSDNRLWCYNDSYNKINGLLLFPENPLLFSSRSILTSEREGPTHGALIMGRYLNPEEIGLLADIVHLPVTVHNLDDSGLPRVIRESATLSENGDIFVNPIDENNVGGYTFLKDIDGVPILVLKVEMPREIFLQGQNTITYFLLAIVGLSVIFTCITLFLLEITFLSRLTRLNDDVNKMGKGGSIVKRITKSGNDELSNLAESINKMLSEIEEKTSKLRISERFATIGEMAAMVGHDLRNPLTGIKNAAYLLKKQVGTTANSKMMEALAIIDEDVIYSNKIVNDLIEYSGNLRLELTEVNPKSLLRRALAMTEIGQGVQLLDKTIDEPAIKADVEKMTRVFVNIVRNALEAMPQKGQLKIESRRAEDSVEFLFCDTGMGISEEVLHRLFTPLLTTKAKGMGFGLAICKRFVEAHGGKISVSSSVGNGTTVRVIIPVEPKVDGGESIWVSEPESSSLMTTKA